MSKKSVSKNTEVITYQMPQLSIAQYLVVVADRGITSEVNYFDVSIWQWTEDRYEKVQLYM